MLTECWFGAKYSTDCFTFLSPLIVITIISGVISIIPIPQIKETECES